MKNSPYVLYDAIGVTLVLAIGSIGLWSLFVHLPGSGHRFSEAKAELANLHQELRTVEGNLHQSNAELALVEKEVGERGALPDSAPVDANLQVIDHLLKKNKINLIKVNPIDKKSYPGLTELNYRVHCQSGFEPMLQFLGDFEAEPFWADLTSLKIIGSPEVPGETTPTHKTEFVVSLFSTQSAKEPGAKP